MESTVESIMTGQVDIDSVLKSNKEKIQSLTLSLESIVHKGYFEIIKSTESLQSLALTQDAPQIPLPPPIKLSFPEPKPQTIPLADQVWERINQQKFTQAALIISENPSAALLRIAKVLQSSFFFNVFDLPGDFLDRVHCLSVFGDTKDLKIPKFVLEQLVQTISKPCGFEEVFEKCREIFEEFVKDEEEIKEFVKETLSDHLPQVQQKIQAELGKVTKIADLQNFISSKSGKFGIPTVWELISSTWETKAESLILSNLSFTVYTSSQDLYSDKSSSIPSASVTFSKYEEKTQETIRLFSNNGEILQSFKEKLLDSLAKSILSSVPKTAPLILVLSFFSHFSELSIYKIFPLDFTGFIQTVQSDVQKQFSTKDILQICIEIRSICGHKTVALPDLQVKFGISQSGFGRMIQKEPEQCLKLPQLPEPLPLIDKLQLPLALSTHLL